MHTTAQFAMIKIIFRLIWRVTYAFVRMAFTYQQKTTSAKLVKVQLRTARVVELRSTGLSATSVPRVMGLVATQWSAYLVQ